MNYLTYVTARTKDVFAPVPLTRKANVPVADVPFSWIGLFPVARPIGVTRVSRLPPVKRSVALNAPEPTSTL